MVAITRRGSDYDPLPLCRTPTERKKRPSFSFGTASPHKSSMLHRKAWPSGSTKRRSDGQQSNTLMIKVIYGMSVLSWILIRIFSRDYQSVMSAINSEAVIIKAQMMHIVDELQSIDRRIQDEKVHLKNLQKTRGALDHEIRFYTEVEKTTGGRINPAPRSGNEQLIKNWLSHRTDALLTKIYKLQRHLQESSRQIVLEKYGEGPHRVEFTVDLISEQGKRSLKRFVVETTSVDLMPISINLFLDMISAGIWDNTIFLHHEEVEHIIAAAPVDYVTEKVKNNQLSQLGWIGLGFPEYSDKYPHSQYTVAFAGQGPTFYINTMDNEEGHSPGMQQHHVLSSDADPCFAKIVDGFDVFDELIRLGLNQKKSLTKVTHEWADAAHAWTHIVSAKYCQSVNDCATRI